MSHSRASVKYSVPTLLVRTCVGGFNHEHMAHRCQDYMKQLSEELKSVSLQIRLSTQVRLLAHTGLPASHTGSHWLAGLSHWLIICVCVCVHSTGTCGGS